VVHRLGTEAAVQAGATSLGGVEALMGGNVKGVVIGPIAVALLSAFVTGSTTVGVVMFFVGLAVMAVLIAGPFLGPRR
jgi:hypothetical protein